MKRTIALAITAMLSFFLAACATTGQTALTPQQVAAQVCPPLTTGLQVLQIAGVLDPKAQAELLIAVPIVDSVCSVGAVVDVSSIDKLGATGIPALLKVVAASSLPEDKKAVVTLAISTAHAILAPIVQQIEAGQAITAAASTAQ